MKWFKTNKNEPSPYTKCTDIYSYSSFLYDYIIKSNRTYRQKDCFSLCFQLETINKCGCYGTLIENLFSNQTRACLNITDYGCLLSIYHQEFDPVKYATDYCPLECDSIQYDMTLSSLLSSSMNDYNFLPGVSSSISYQEYVMQTVTILVYYPQLEFTLLEETPAMSWQV